MPLVEPMLLCLPYLLQNKQVAVSFDTPSSAEMTSFLIDKLQRISVLLLIYLPHLQEYLRLITKNLKSD